jgi:hypothetical protein
MSETLRFGSIELAPLQLLGALYELSLSSFPIIKVDTRTVLLNKVSNPIKYRKFEVQRPPIDPIGSSHS